MSKPDDPITRLLSAIEEPQPPQMLRERTLSRAEAAWDRPPAPDRWSRAWHSRALRLAWAVAVLVLVAANIAIRTGSHARPRVVSAAAAAQERAGLKELQGIVELPRIRLRSAGIEGTEGRAAGPRVPRPKTPHHDTEDKS